jgi:long-chain fatty acid transport protein
MSNHLKQVRLVLLATVLTLGFDSLGVGFRLPNQDPEGIARGNAFVATADNPSAIYYNPAGITQLRGQQFQAGLYYVSASTRYTSTTGATAKTDSSFQPVPQMYYVHNLEDKPITLGLGVYAPYGLSLDYGENNPFNLIAEYGKLAYVSINPVIAWQITPELSFGIGPSFNYSKAILANAVLRFKGDGLDVGFNAGIRWQPHEKWAFGAAYHSATKIEYKGNADILGIFRTESTADFQYPQYIVGGVSFRPTENWNLEFNLDWTDWDHVNQAVFQKTALGDLPFIFNYRSSFMYEFGITRKLKNGWFVSTGYFYSENSSPDANFNPIVPDANLHLGSCGFGHKGTRWDWVVAYHFGYGPGRTVKGSPTVGPQNADGRYRTFNNAVNVSLNYKF